METFRRSVQSGRNHMIFLDIFVAEWRGDLIRPLFHLAWAGVFQESGVHILGLCDQPFALGEDGKREFVIPLHEELLHVDCGWAM